LATLFGILVFAIPFRTVRVGYRVVAVIAIGAGSSSIRLWPAILTKATITTSGDASKLRSLSPNTYFGMREILPAIWHQLINMRRFFSIRAFATPSV